MCHIKLFILFAFLSSSSKSICICDRNKCLENFLAESLRANIYSAGFYKEIANYIGQDKDIRIFIGVTDEDNNFHVEIQLLFFNNQNIEISLIDNMYKPKILKIDIDLEFSYKFNLLNVKSLDLYLNVIGQEGSTIEIGQLWIDGKILNSKEDFGKYLIKVNELKISADLMVFFKSINILSNAVAHVLAMSAGNYYFTIPNKVINISFGDLNASIITIGKTDLSIEGNQNQNMCNVYLRICDDVVKNQLLSINIISVINIFIEGDWTNVPINNYISAEFASIYSSVSYLPFYMNISDLRLFIDRIITIPTKKFHGHLNFQHE